jgi:hypothetical protein
MNPRIVASEAAAARVMIAGRKRANLRQAVKWLFGLRPKSQVTRVR